MGASADASHRTPRLFGVPCWILPVISGCIWLSTLISMLIVWVAQGSPVLPRLSPGQRLAYISDIASTTWGKPLFIASSAITVSIFGLAFAAERWLRHRGLLLHVPSRRSTILSWCATVSTIIGAFGVILLTVFDKKNHEMVHLCMVGVFINGYVFAAIFMALEKRRLSKKYPSNKYISRSWKIKAFFAALEAVLTCFFVILAWCGYPNESVITEWCIAPLFCIYMCSFAMDFLPTPEMQVMDVSWLVLGAADMGRDDDVSTIRNDSVWTAASEKEKDIELGFRNDSCWSLEGPQEQHNPLSAREWVRRPSTGTVKNWSLRDPEMAVTKESKSQPVTRQQTKVEEDLEHFSVSPKGTSYMAR